MWDQFAQGVGTNIFQSELFVQIVAIQIKTIAIKLKVQNIMSLPRLLFLLLFEEPCLPNYNVIHEVVVRKN